MSPPPLTHTQTHTESQQQTTNSDATLSSDLPAIDAAADAREAEVTEAAQAAAVPHSLSVLAKLVAGAEVRDETYIRKSRDTHTDTHTHARHMTSSVRRGWLHGEEACKEGGRWTSVCVGGGGGGGGGVGGGGVWKLAVLHHHLCLREQAEELIANVRRSWSVASSTHGREEASCGRTYARLRSGGVAPYEASAVRNSNIQ